MSSFSIAAEKASNQPQPVVRGMTARTGKKTPDEFAKSLRESLGGEWIVAKSETGWLDAEVSAPIDLGAAWEAARNLGAQGYEDAEPLLLMKAPSPEDPDANARLDLWGAPYSWSDTQAIANQSLPKNWSIKAMRVDKAWAKYFANPNLAGAGVVIAHPDTGYSKHPQIIGNIDQPGLNFVENNGDAADQFVGGLLQNPGHGTATGSVIASPMGDNGEKGDVIGVAPGARIWPIRVSTSVVHFDFLNVSRAIESAVGKAQVISMSLGGPKSSSRLRDAVQHALDDGIIVVSAAGNMVPAVMFPAAIPGVVAMAASNPIDGPWRWSGFGDEVVATAPGEMIWNARAGGDGKYAVDRGAGTSFSTAAVAGIAALWLSRHGRNEIIKKLGGDVKLVPFAFHKLLSETANSKFDFVRDGKGGFGTGVVDALALLDAPLPSAKAVEEYRDRILGEKNRGFFNLTLTELANFFRMPTRAGRSFATSGDSNQPAVQPDAIRGILDGLLGDSFSSPYFGETVTLVQTIPMLRQRMLWAARRSGDPERRRRSLALLREDLLTQPVSNGLRAQLQRDAAPPGTAVTKTMSPPPAGPGSCAPSGPPLPKPHVRRLRAYAFDPSLTLQMENRAINQVTIEVPWEDLKPGPVGEYLEIVDVDPATDCAYDPVDLDHPYLLAQDGLPPSEGNPQFHQQMVYAVSMKTIKSFEKALGRPALWSHLRPWRDPVDLQNCQMIVGSNGEQDKGDQYIQRLRIYPHALREENAYYSPEKRALLFGYFAAKDGNPGEVYPEGIVFSCLSHDVIAHETTHALLDGMHGYFSEPTNPDVFAFHEGFSDLVALFQHFSYAGVLRSQVSRARGNLGGENLLVQLAQQFGKATGKGHALRDAIGGVRKTKKTVVASGPAGERERTIEEFVWDRYRPDAEALDDMSYAGEAHRRGSILVAAVFDAFLAIYESRVADLVRIATGGSGKLPDGNLQPDLVDRMCEEARKSAEHVLNICIRALDYTPPVDITFGEYLRALITADRDLVPEDPHAYRTAFIQAFRAWGIYPRDVRVLSEESLAWYAPEGMKLIDPTYGIFEEAMRGGRVSPLERLRQALIKWQPNGERRSIFECSRTALKLMHNHVKHLLLQDPLDPNCPLPDTLKPLSQILRDALLTKYEREIVYKQFPPLDGKKKRKDDLRPMAPGYAVSNIRPARRIGPNGEFLTELVFEVVRETFSPDAETTAQTEYRKREGEAQDPRFADQPFSGGVTFIVSMDNWEVRYAIYKRFGSDTRRGRQADYSGKAMHGFGAAEYLCTHYDGDPQDRVVNMEAMRASSCECRGGRSSQKLAEPFAMLHREPATSLFDNEEMGR